MTKRMKNAPKSKQPYWFKRRRYGYGWFPVTWQGWVAILLTLVVIVVGGLTLAGAEAEDQARETGFYLLFVALAVTSLVVICCEKGPKPKWRWGKRDSDNPDEDF